MLNSITAKTMYRSLVNDFEELIIRQVNEIVNWQRHKASMGCEVRKWWWSSQDRSFYKCNFLLIYVYYVFAKCRCCGIPVYHIYMCFFFKSYKWQSYFKIYRESVSVGVIVGTPPNCLHIASYCLIIPHKMWRVICSIWIYYVSSTRRTSNTRKYISFKWDAKRPKVQREKRSFSSYKIINDKCGVDLARERYVVLVSCWLLIFPIWIGRNWEF